MLSASPVCLRVRRNSWQTRVLAHAPAICVYPIDSGTRFVRERASVHEVRTRGLYAREICRLLPHFFGDVRDADQILFE